MPLNRARYHDRARTSPRWARCQVEGYIRPRNARHLPLWLSVTSFSNWFDFSCALIDRAWQLPQQAPVDEVLRAESLLELLDHAALRARKVRTLIHV